MNGMLFPWGLHIGQRHGTRVVVDSLGLDSEGRATYRVRCEQCEMETVVTSQEFSTLAECCPRRRRAKA
ncbi:MAG: hypothetical protein GEV06_01495 [Luteitalea sp.]|nr:hypothetical protein [Luteitalea sp.]